MKKMGPLKASRLDGFLMLFFHKYWHIVGFDVSAYYFKVLQGEVAMEEINDIHIVLIPKVSRARSITQYRPISLCNVIYKIFAKVIVNRISVLLDSCIHEN